MSISFRRQPMISMFLAITLSAGCSAGAGGGGGGGNVAGSGGDDGALMTFPDAPGILMTIDEDDGTRSFILHGSGSSDGAEIVVTGYDFDAGEGMGTVLVDGDGWPTSLVLGSTKLETERHSNGTFDYQVYEDGLLLSSGTAIAIDGVAAKINIGLAARVTPAGVLDCVQNRVDGWAADTILAHEGIVSTGGMLGSHPFRQCIEDQAPLWDLAFSYCIAVYNFSERIAETQSSENSGLRASVVRWGFVFLVHLDQAVSNAAQDINEKLWNEENCRDANQEDGTNDQVGSLQWCTLTDKITLDYGELITQDNGSCGQSSFAQYDFQGSPQATLLARIHSTFYNGSSEEVWTARCVGINCDGATVSASGFTNDRNINSDGQVSTRMTLEIGAIRSGTSCEWIADDPVAANLPTIEVVSACQ